jgi:heme/copper-type cytochrome/quinol oxidase subunit 2
VVWIDISIVLVFVLAIYRLKFYEDLTVVDLRNGQMRIEDFSVLFQDIPIDEDDYNNNPELLTAMMATHIEDIC